MIQNTRNRRPIGLLTHHIPDQAMEGFDAILDDAAAEDLGAADIPSREVDPGSLSLALMLNEGRSSRGGRKGRMLAVTRLNPRLLVGGEHKIFGAKRLSLPETLVEIEDRTGLFNKQGITRKDPASMPPRANGVLAEPAPNGGSADFGRQPLIENFLADVGDREARQWQTLAMRQLTSESFYLNDETGGKSGPSARRGVRPRGQANGPGRIACATC